MTAQLLSTTPVNFDNGRLPRHVAVIMDGNGRWATRRGLPRIVGHRQGADTLKEILRYCQNLGIETLTAYAFSTENWARPMGEVNFLMTLFESLLRQELKEMHSEGVRIKFIGSLDLLAPSLQREIEGAIALTAKNKGIQFNVAINYGSRQEILKACRHLAGRVARGEIEEEAIDENLFAAYLDTAGCPDPDLLIRTSGEMRLSNFLLWQIAYTEIYVTDTLWPDFSPEELTKALAVYQRRDRRFGKV